MCAHVLEDGQLVCTRTDAHDPAARGGHVYIASAGPDLSRERGDDD